MLLCHILSHHGNINNVKYSLSLTEIETAAII